MTSLFPLEASFLRGSRGHRPCLEWRRGGRRREIGTCARRIKGERGTRGRGACRGRRRRLWDTTVREEGRRVPPPLFHFRRTNRHRPPTGKDTGAFLHLHLTYTPKQRERKTGIRDTGRRGRYIPSHPSIHPSIPPSAIKRGRASSDLFLPAPRSARGRPCPSSPVLLRHRRRNGTRKTDAVKEASLQSHLAPRPVGRPASRRRRRRSLSSFPLPPFLIPYLSTIRRAPNTHKRRRRRREPAKRSLEGGEVIRSAPSAPP